MATKKNKKIFDELMRLYDLRREQVVSIENTVWELLSGRKDPVLSETRALADYIKQLRNDIGDEPETYAVFKDKNEVLWRRLDWCLNLVNNVINGKYTLAEMSYCDVLPYNPFKK